MPGPRKASAGISKKKRPAAAKALAEAPPTPEVEMALSPDVMEEQEHDEMEPEEGGDAASFRASSGGVMRRPPRLRARFATAGTGEGEGETSSGFVSSADFDFASTEVAFADGLGVFFSPAPGISGEARDAGGACLLLGAIPRAQRRRRCASGNARVRVWGWRDRARVRGMGRTRSGRRQGLRRVV